MNFIRSFYVVVILLGTSLFAGNAQAQTLQKVELFTETAGDNKDKDTCVFVDVKTSDDKVLLAHVANGDCSNDDRTEYNDDSTHTLALVVDSPGTNKASAAGFKVRLSQVPHGNDKWKIRHARVTLFFSGGETLVAEKRDFELKNKASTEFAQQ
jgi:hypothetical protein